MNVDFLSHFLAKIEQGMTIDKDEMLHKQLILCRMA